MFSSTFVVLALSASAFANVFITQPVASTTWTGGQQATVSWQDSGAAPALKDFGPSKVSIYAGNAQQQTMLQNIAPSVDVSTTASIVFTPDASLGPNADQYFVRFESLALKDATSPQYPALAFSAKFTLAGMNGQFNASVQAQIDGQSTAPIVSPTGAGGSSAGAPAATTTGSSPAASKAPASSGSAKPTGTGAAAAASSNGASSVPVAGASAFVAVAAALFGTLL